jgi:hypothetical protein
MTPMLRFPALTALRALTALTALTALMPVRKDVPDP